MLRRLLKEALELASSAFNEVRPKAPDDGLVRQRRHDRARHAAREAVAQPREVRVAPDDAELAVRELLAVRGGVDLVAHVGIHALALLFWGRLTVMVSTWPSVLSVGPTWAWESIIVSFFFAVFCAPLWLCAACLLRVLIQVM